MDEEGARKLAELKARLEELKRRNPAHCSGLSTFVGHQMTPKLYEELEEIEEQIKALEAEG